MLVLPDEHLSNKPEHELPLPFLRLAFRPFFWLGALFSMLSIIVWALYFTGHLVFSPYGGGLFWHSHEMLFGFTSAIIVGFLLTAVQTWTGVASIKGKTLAGLVVIWITARLFIALPFLLPETYQVLILMFDIAFLPIAACFLAIPIIKAKKWRNLFFVPILLIMALLNGLMHLSMTGQLALSFITLSHVMILMVTLVMCIMGGRVFPMFTANGTQTPRVQSIPWLEKVAIVSVIASVIVTAKLFSLPSELEASIYIIAAMANFVRAARWRIWVTLGTPLVWSLHLSYWAICIGLLMLGLHKFNVVASASLAFHAITVGGISLMILAMISRVSLGHTGRAIVVGKMMALAFSFILLAFVLRVLAPLVLSSYSLLILLASFAWALAYGLFLVNYTKVLFSPRVDGGEG